MKPARSSDLPKAILFDLDGTLWGRTSAVRVLAGARHQHLAAVVGDIPREQYVERIVALDDLGRMDKRVLYETVVSSSDYRTRTSPASIATSGHATAGSQSP
jgi:FMN phosphatase YigB (HAD superfamily)